MFSLALADNPERLYQRDASGTEYNGYWQLQDDEKSYLWFDLDFNSYDDTYGGYNYSTGITHSGCPTDLSPDAIGTLLYEDNKETLSGMVTIYCAEVFGGDVPVAESDSDERSRGEREDIASEEGYKISNSVSGQENCKTLDACQELDRVWLSISDILNTDYEVWDPVAFTWRTFENLYSASTGLTAPVIADYDVNSSALDEDMASLDPSFIEKVNEISGELDINPVHLLAVMKFETGGTFSPTAKNPGSTAVGLIQFLESTANNLGTTTSALKSMTATEQLDYVKKYFEKIKASNPSFNGQDLGDVAMAVIWPKAVGETDNYVLFSRGTDAYNKNSGLDVNNDGNVIKAEYVNWVIKKSGYYEE